MYKLIDLSFFCGKKVLLTGHTGFKGSWMSQVLLNAGAKLTGYALSPPTNPSLFQIVGLEKQMDSVIGDIRDLPHLSQVVKKIQPEIVIHLAAQPIVRESYVNPVYTYETNIMGTVNILECIRLNSCVRSFLNVTTDKVYENREWTWGYRENETLNGFDPYSNSKSCSELVTQCYKRSFLSNNHTAISTVRAGNVIGGGDFAKDRIIPDCVRAMQKKEPIIIRNPNSTRPYQHVLESVFAYLMIAKKQYEDGGLSGYYNVGPDDCDCVTTEALADLFCRYWGDGANWENHSLGGPHEASFLKLDCSLIKQTFGWRPRWHIDDAIEKTCEWSKEWLAGEDVFVLMNRQIHEYMGNSR